LFSARYMMLFAAAATLAACGGKGPAPISSGERYSTASDVVEDYRLGVGDRLRVTVYREADLTGEYAVAADGTVSLPLIGNVKALGRSVDEFTRDAQTRYGDGYLRDPKLSVSVINYRPFFILGEVDTPGQYPYTIGMTLPMAVATAKHRADQAARRRRGGSLPRRARAADLSRRHRSGRRAFLLIPS
jgi:polysaccharide export outer membrane protein